MSPTPEQLSASGQISHSQLNILAICTGTDGDEDETYGLEIKRNLEDYMDEEINHGRLYPNLDELVELGLVEKGEIDKRTNSYTTTEKGIEVLESRVEWLDSNTN